MSGPKVLFFDLETAPLLVYAWRLGDQHVGLEQLHTDWSIMSWAAKWLHSNKMMYQDLRHARNPRADKSLLNRLWELLDEADIVVTQNGIEFDSKVANARFIKHGMHPPSSYKHIDTLKIARKSFKFTSNKLAYTTEHLNQKYVKLAHKKFPGMDLWKECLVGNQEAWKEMELYNKHDVLALEELYKRLYPWDNSINFAVYHDNDIKICACGSSNFKHNGYTYREAGKFQRFRCVECGAEGRHAKNLFSKEKRESLTRRSR